MRVQLAKWGNSLAVRIPGSCARQAHLKAGDAVEVEVTPTGDLRLHPVAAEPFDKAAFLQEVRRLRAGLPEGASVVEAMRQSDRY
jgi:antitoxin MazE